MKTSCFFRSSVPALVVTVSFLLVSSLGISKSALAQRSAILNERGTLQNGDQVSGDGSLYDVYSFEGQAGQTVRILMESSEFDTYLVLVSPAGEVIATNDDITANNTNSEIQITLPQTGTYGIAANAYDSSDRGNYTLLVTDTDANGSTNTTTTTARAGFELYNHQNLYTIEHPIGWVIDTSGLTGTGLTFWNRQPPRFGGGDWPTDLVRTNIGIVDGSLDSVARGFEQSEFEEITRRGDITIGGRRALRLWTESVNASGIYTIVEYSSNQTAVIGSFYASNDWVEDIQDIHWSFRKLN